MKSKWLILALIFSLTINAAVLATIGYHSFRNLSRKPSVPWLLSPGDSHLYQSLDLSNAQLAMMEPLARKFHGRIAELRASMEGKKTLLVDLLQGGGDPVRIEGLCKEMAAIQDEIQREVIAHIFQTKKILNTKQQEKFFSLMRQSMAHAMTSFSPPSGGNQ
jgi:Spy/CpxP family protein refolding chaperone